MEVEEQGGGAGPAKRATGRHGDEIELSSGGGSSERDTESRFDLLSPLLTL